MCTCRNLEPKPRQGPDPDTMIRMKVSQHLRQTPTPSLLSYHIFNICPQSHWNGESLHSLDPGNGSPKAGGLKARVWILGVRDIPVSWAISGFTEQQPQGSAVGTHTPVPPSTVHLSLRDSTRGPDEDACASATAGPPEAKPNDWGNSLTG